MDDLYIIMDADLNAEVDVDVLAKAFNMDRTTFLGHSLVIDGFASTGLKAVMVDKNWFMVYDQLLKMETVRNSKGLYWNYFFHVWQVLSASRFSNAVAFVLTANAPAVTSVIVDPVIAERKAGKTLQLTAYVRATDGLPHTVTWAVAGSTSATTVQAGTTIDANGLLTIAANQTGELLVTASTDGGIDLDGAGADTTAVIGESIITVIPA
jgi:hypothetical protein